MDIHRQNVGGCTQGGLIFLMPSYLLFENVQILRESVHKLIDLQVRELEDSCAEAERKGKELFQERTRLQPEIQRTRKEITETIGPQIEEQQAARDETDSALREKELEKAAIENKTVTALVKLTLLLCLHFSHIFLLRFPSTPCMRSSFCLGSYRTFCNMNTTIESRNAKYYCSPYGDTTHTQYYEVSVLIQEPEHSITCISFKPGSGSPI